MKEPSRLLEEPGTDALQASLLRIARGEGPSAGLAAGTLSAPSDAAQTTASHALASSAAGKWGVVALGASLAVYFSVQPKPLSLPRAVAPVTASVLAPPSRAVEVASANLVPVTKLEDLPTLAEGADAPKSGGAPTLAEEVAAIKSAKAALASANATQALRELDAYKGRFPRGRLAQEATVVRIEALISMGNPVAAGTIADHFLASHADSPYAARVRTLVSR